MAGCVQQRSVKGYDGGQYVQEMSLPGFNNGKCVQERSVKGYDGGSMCKR